MTPRLAPAERRQSIVEAAGVSEALVFKYFASKTALYEAMFESCDEVNPAFAQLQQRPPGTGALVVIVQMIVDYFTGLDHACERDKAHHRLFLRSLLEDGEFARAGLRAFADILLPLFTRSYDAARAAGDLTPGAPSASAAFWLMAQTPMMIGSLALTGADAAMKGFSQTEMLRGMLRGIGLHEDAIATHCYPDRAKSPPEAFAAAG
jgi:AcrR family transcriptional regulator